MREENFKCFGLDLIVQSLARVVQMMDNAIHSINYYPADNVVCFVKTYPLDSDLSGDQHYLPFEELGGRIVII